MEKKKQKGKFAFKRKGRELTIQSLYEYELTKLDSKDSLDWLSDKDKLDERSISYYEKLYKGTIENLQIVDDFIREFAKKNDFNKIMPIDKAILRFAVFSLMFEKDIPAVIVINEAIELAKKYGGIDAHKFINGVLDGIRKKLIEKGSRKVNE